MIKRGLCITISLALALFVNFNFVTGTDTSLNIVFNPVPPSQINNIPNITWTKNINLTDYFDLDNYFVDNETLNYTATFSSNMTILINDTTNEVSFYPDKDFTGLTNVTFLAYDGFLYTESNVVFLNVSDDTTPPRWSNLRKNKIDIYQNQVITFSADWIDNLGLGKFVLSVKQLGSWVNYSEVAFSGLENTSTYSAQISAPGGSTIEWLFIGFDAAGNMNVSSVQSFTVKSLPTFPPAPREDNNDETTPADETETTQSNLSKVEDFKLDPSDSFKVTVNTDSSVTISIKITNNGTVSSTYSIDILNLPGFKALVSAQNFTLTPGKSTIVTIEFTPSPNLNPDVYFGIIKVKAKSRTKSIPIAIELIDKKSDINVTVKVLDKYKNVKPSSLVKANITLLNKVNSDKTNITLYYAILTFSGSVLNSRTEELTLNSETAEFERELQLPEVLNQGDYIFLARAFTEKSIAIGSDYFFVGETFSVAGYLKSKLIFIIVILAIFVISILLTIENRNRRRLRLLNLYLKITELKNLIKDGHTDEAIALFVRIKSVYGEPVNESDIANKESIKNEINKFVSEFDKKYGKLNIPPVPVASVANAESKDAKKEVKADAQVASVPAGTTPANAKTEEKENAPKESEENSVTTPKKESTEKNKQKQKKSIKTKKVVKKKNAKKKNK